MRTLMLTVSLAALCLTGCAGLSDRDERILSGAAIGGVIGNVVTDGSVGGTIGGAAIGGILGNEVDRDSRNRDFQRRYNNCRTRYSVRYCDRNIR